jgi:hypothetical protein
MERALIGNTPQERLENEYLSKSYREMYLAVRTFHMLAEPDSGVSLELEMFMEKIFMETWKDKNIVIEHLQEGMRLIHGIIDKSASIPPSKNMAKGGEGVVNKTTTIPPVPIKPGVPITGPSQMTMSKSHQNVPKGLSKHLRGENRLGIGSKRTEWMRDTLAGLEEEGEGQESDAPPR